MGDEELSMRVLSVIAYAARFLWRYLATAALLGGLAAAMLGVALSGTGPEPQQPPEGYSVASGRVSLEWNKGTRKGPITLEVSIEDPTFSKPIVKKTTGAVSHLMAEIRPGKTYFWRLVQGSETSPTASFTVPADYVDF
jgi:hypothetical protein